MSAAVTVRRVLEVDANSPDKSPILLYFQHGQVNPNIDLGTRLIAQMYDESNDKTISKHDKLKRKQREVVVVQGETDMTYIGTSHDFLNSNIHSGNMRTLIGIRHKSRLKVYDTKPFHVSPYIDSRAHLKVEESSRQSSPQQRTKASSELVKAFGSKAKRLHYERRENMEIDSKHMNESINIAAEKSELPSPISSDHSTVFRLLPSCNRESKDVHSVYSIHDIISEDDLNQLEDLANTWLHASSSQILLWKQSNRFSNYFFEMQGYLSSKKDTYFPAKIVLYTELLISLLKLKFNDFRKKLLPLPPEFPASLIDKALQNFTTVNANKIRCRSEEYKDKTCCYIMVLVLLVNNFEFDVQLMSTSLQIIHINKLLTLAKTVGITITFNPYTKEYRGILKMPLPKSVDRRIKTKHRRR